MNVLTHISLNFQQPNYLTVYAAQNDRLSRYINAQLLDGSAPWTLPTGGLMTIRYRKPDGTSGFYDTLEDGSPAYNVETDGSITFGLAEQALTVPGAVPVELNFYNAAGSKLSTLTFIVAVKPSAYSDEDIASSDYYNILTAKMQQLAELSDQAEGDYQDYLSALSAFVGAPRTAPTAADMLDTNLVYVYTGSETGYTYGDWYYYNGREWTSGGVYNSAAISLDATLTNADKPAQAKAAGDLVLVQDTQPTAPVNKLWFPLTDPEDEQVPTWDEFSDLKSSMNQKAPGIFTESSEAFVHDNPLGVATSIHFVGNPYAFETAKFADSKNWMPNFTPAGGTAGGNVAWYKDGHFVRFDGTCTTNYTNRQIYNATDVEIPAGSYKLYVKFHLGESTISTSENGNFILTVKYADGTQVRVQNYPSLTERDMTFVYDIDTEVGINGFYITFSLVNGNVYDGFRIWYGLYASDAVFVDTGVFVGDGETFDYRHVVDATVIDTMQHASSVEALVDTKTYIDDTAGSTVHYTAPEDFGAVGDGVTDDTTALQACVDYAINNRVPLRGYGVYKTSDTIVFAQSPSSAAPNYSYEINRLLYSGTDDYAIEINGSCGRFVFGYIGSSQKGIHLIDTNGATLNYIFAIYVKSEGDCFVSEGGTSGYTSYNTIRILRPNSTNGNCFVNGAKSGENRYYDSSCVCRNGWAIHGCNGRYYNFALESDVQNGIYAETGDAANLISFRWQELADSFEAGVKGTVLKVTGEGVHIRVLGPEIPIRCIDVSEMLPAADVTLPIYKTKGLILQASVTANDAKVHLGRAADIRCGKIICTPELSASYTVTQSDLDLRGSNPPGYPTRFVIDASCNIHLSDSYCAIGYSSFIVDQSTAGKSCSIYKSDDDVTPIFDGTQLGQGIYRITAYCDGSANQNLIYYTNNDSWLIEKIG